MQLRLLPIVLVSLASFAAVTTNAAGDDVAVIDAVSSADPTVQWTMIGDEWTAGSEPMTFETQVTLEIRSATLNDVVFFFESLTGATIRLADGVDPTTAVPDLTLVEKTLADGLREISSLIRLVASPDPGSDWKIDPDGPSRFA